MTQDLTAAGHRESDKEVVAGKADDHSLIHKAPYVSLLHQRNYGLSLNVTNGWKIGSQLLKENKKTRSAY